MTKKKWMAILFYFASLSFVFLTAWYGGRKELKENWMFGFDFELYDPNNYRCQLNDGHNYRVEGWYSVGPNPKLEVWINRSDGSFDTRHKWEARRVYGYYFDSEEWAKNFFKKKN
jgi:hypothetical protein